MEQIEVINKLQPFLPSGQLLWPHTTGMYYTSQWSHEPKLWIWCLFTHDSYLMQPQLLWRTLYHLWAAWPCLSVNSCTKPEVSMRASTCIWVIFTLGFLTPMLYMYSGSSLAFHSNAQGYLIFMKYLNVLHMEEMQAYDIQSISRLKKQQQEEFYTCATYSVLMSYWRLYVGIISYHTLTVWVEKRWLWLIFDALV